MLVQHPWASGNPDIKPCHAWIHSAFVSSTKVMVLCRVECTVLDKMSRITLPSSFAHRSSSSIGSHYDGVPRHGVSLCFVRVFAMQGWLRNYFWSSHWRNGWFLQCVQAIWFHMLQFTDQKKQSGIISRKRSFAKDNCLKLPMLSSVKVKMYEFDRSW